MRVFFFGIAGFLLLFALREVRSDEPPRFELKDGDRIVLVGDTFIERDQRYGYLETELSIGNPDKNLVFRNLGWSGDTVAGVSRSGFDRPEAGFEQLRQQILAARPTVVVVGYGMADSFAGEAGLSAFEQGLARLLNVIDSTGARVAFLSPLAHASMGRPLPDPTSHNHELALYRDLIKRVASQRKAAFVDLFDHFHRLYSAGPGHELMHPERLTDNGIHLTGQGYREAALFIGDQLGLTGAFAPRVLVLGLDGTIVREEGTRASHIEKTAAGLRFEAIDRFLPFPVTSGRAGPTETTIEPWRLVINDLTDGRYLLKIDGVPITAAAADQWRRGVILGAGPQFDQVEAVRAAINRKNDLFFYRWRPQNITYLFGFRKHEQGNNAVEIPQFDPLVAEQEKIIARLKKPAPHHYEITRVEKEAAR